MTELIVYWAAFFAFLFYLTALPVRAGVAWKSGQPVRMGITIGPVRFSAHGRIKYVPGTGLTASLTHDRSGKLRELSLMQQMSGAGAATGRLSALSGAVNYLAHHVTPRLLQIDVRLSLPDAAQTAFLFGLLRMLLSAVRAVRPELPLAASVSADFRSLQSQAGLCGILSCRLGHIMAAALIWRRDELSRRISTWRTNSRSKTS